MTRSTLFGIRLPIRWIRQTVSEIGGRLAHFTHQEGREA